MPVRPAVYVHLLPRLIPPGALKGGVAVVVDVLRATTVMVHALTSGCEAVIPCLEIDDARRAAASLPPGTAILGGERGGLPIEGFDLGNSPGDYTPEVCQGKTLVMTTTNGTKAILASLEAERVLIGAFGNLGPLIRQLSVNLISDDGLPVHIVCSGTEGFISLEDSLLAGALVDGLAYLNERFTPMGNDEALIVRETFVGATQRPGDRGELKNVMSRGRGGQNVKRIGLLRDIETAARVDDFEFVPELRRDPLRIVWAGGPGGAF